MEDKAKFIQQPPAELKISQSILNDMDTMFAGIESDRCKFRDECIAAGMPFDIAEALTLDSINAAFGRLQQQMFHS